jgi:hypothetical protein
MLSFFYRSAFLDHVRSGWRTDPVATAKDMKLGKAMARLLLHHAASVDTAS